MANWCRRCGYAFSRAEILAEEAAHRRAYRRRALWVMGVGAVLIIAMAALFSRYADPAQIAAQSSSRITKLTSAPSSRTTTIDLVIPTFRNASDALAEVGGVIVAVGKSAEEGAIDVPADTRMFIFNVWEQTAKGVPARTFAVEIDGERLRSANFETISNDQALRLAASFRIYGDGGLLTGYCRSAVASAEPMRGKTCRWGRSKAIANLR